MNKFNPDIPRRRSIRLYGHDYAQEGLYFVTLCARNRECLFGEIAGEDVRLNETGETVEKCWYEITQHYPDTALHNHIVMPNHFHGIIEITKSSVGAENLPPSFPPSFHGAEDFPPLRPNCKSCTLGAIIRGFKIGTTLNMGFSPWQRNYYEHIIRDANDYTRIDDYIIHNPIQWETDCFYI
jgi:REP element-mobilizing transposase RayT